MSTTFGMSIRLWNKKTVERHEYVRRGVTLKLFAAIIRDTPVLTGLLRANWICSIAGPDTTTSFAKGSPGPAIALMTSQVESSAPGDTVVLTNRLPYVFRIEYEGWSHTKSPAGMVRRNIARFRQLISNQLQEVK